MNKVKFGRSSVGEDEIDELMTMMDTDGDGTISLDEFATYVLSSSYRQLPLATASYPNTSPNTSPKSNAIMMMMGNRRRHRRRRRHRQ
eukprot:COSAG05_NODE_1494_length_4714_cov_41.398267_4_plen_88_part_00